MSVLDSLFERSQPIIGMIHIDALPGTPRNRLSPDEIVAQARAEAETYLKAGINGLMIENMHDLPYLNRQVGPEITAMMTRAALEIKAVVKEMPVGIQILAGANRDALAVAQTANLQFIRAEGFVFAHVADEGLMDADAGPLLRYRKQIGAEAIRIFTDIKKKHSAHAITSDVDIVETAHAAAFCGSEGVILTGASTGVEADIAEIEAVKKASSLPVLVGSGVRIDNLQAYMNAADALIIGSWLKVEGNWANPVDYERAARLMEKADAIRNQGK